MEDIGKWGQAALEILMRETQLARRVHRDCSNEFAQLHDVVPLQEPFNLAPDVELDQQMWSSLQIQDREATQSFSQMVQYFVEPCMISMARNLDMLILQSVYESLDRNTQHLPRLTGNPEYTIRQARRVLNGRRVPQANRNLIIDPPAEAELLRHCVSTPGATYFGFTPVLYFPTSNTALPEGTNFAWGRDSIALVTRPIRGRRETHDQTAGRPFSIACNDHLSLRVDMGYEMQYAAVKITYTLLAGVIILDSTGIVSFDGQTQRSTATAW